MKRKLMFLGLAIIGLASCNGGFKTAPGGLVYNIAVDKSGPSIQPGDFIAVNVTLKNDADSVLGSTYESGIPSMQIFQKSRQKGDIFEGIALLSEGDSAIIKTNIDSMYKGHQRPATLKGKYQVYLVKVVKVIPKGNLSEQVFQGRAQAYYNSVMEAFKKNAKDSEPGKIKKYIADNKLNVTKTDSGLYYQVTQQGSGIKPTDGDTVVVNYVLRFITGKVVETSIKSEAIKNKLQINPMNPYKPIHLTLGARGMIKGWDEGMRLLNKGSKAVFVIPSALAYGDGGNQGIPPFSPLVFDIELVDIIHPNPNAPKPVVPPMPMQLQKQIQATKK
jgi:FKBP-type peptidyl-prolyl cis-trans isomerase FkpA